MPTAYLSPSQLKELTDVSVAPGAGQNGYPLTWNNTTGRWVASGINRLEAPQPLLFRTGLTAQTVETRARVHPKGSFVFSSNNTGALVLAGFSTGTFAGNDPTPRPLFKLVSRLNSVYGLLQIYYALLDVNQNVYNAAQVYRVIFEGSQVQGFLLLGNLIPPVVTPTFSVSGSTGDNAMTVLGSYSSVGSGWSISMGFQWIPSLFDIDLLSIEPV